MADRYPLNFEAQHTDAKLLQNILALTANARVKAIIYHEATVDVASLIDAAGASQSVTVTGVALGDMVIGRSMGVSTAGITVTADVTAANTVIVRFQNESGGTVDLASTTLRLLIADLT